MPFIYLDTGGFLHLLEYSFKEGRHLYGREYRTLNNL